MGTSFWSMRWSDSGTPSDLMTSLACAMADSMIGAIWSRGIWSRDATVLEHLLKVVNSPSLIARLRLMIRVSMCASATWSKLAWWKRTASCRGIERFHILQTSTPSSQWLKAKRFFSFDNRLTLLLVAPGSKGIWYAQEFKYSSPSSAWRMSWPILWSSPAK